MLFYLALVAGVVFFQITDASFADNPYFDHALYLLLAVGLYGSVRGIDIAKLRKDRNIVVSAITLGVVAKGLIIGAIMWAIFQSVFAFLLGFIVAQIDPLSVSVLVNKHSKHFSTRAKNIVRAWSSFDDPITVLVSLYILLPLSTSSAFDLGEYALHLIANILFAVCFYMLNKHLASGPLLGVAFLLAVPLQLMLGIALVGLFLRPKIDWLPRMTTAAFLVAAFLLGTLLSYDLTNALIGVVLGVAAFFAHYVVSNVITHNMRTSDRRYISVAQFNGLTAAILALLISADFPEAVVLVGISIATTNALYYLANARLDRKFS